MYQLTPAEEASLVKSLKQAERGDFASDERSAGRLGEARFVRVRYTKEAVSELAQVVAGLAKTFPQRANRLQSRLREAVSLLADHPCSGQRTSRETFHRIVLTPYPYLVFSRVAADEVAIVAIRHAARDPDTMPDA